VVGPPGADTAKMVPALFKDREKPNIAAAANEGVANVM